MTHVYSLSATDPSATKQILPLSEDTLLEKAISTQGWYMAEKSETALLKMASILLLYKMTFGWHVIAVKGNLRDNVHSLLQHTEECDPLVLAFWYQFNYEDLAHCLGAPPPLMPSTGTVGNTHGYFDRATLLLHSVALKSMPHCFDNEYGHLTNLTLLCRAPAGLYWKHSWEISQLRSWWKGWLL